MILIGTDDGIYRWFEGCNWPIYHSLQDRAIMGLASPGAGVLAAFDRDGEVFESVNNGQDWRTIPLPEGAGGPLALTVWGAPATIVLATRPMGVYSRAVGTPIPRAEDEPAMAASGRGLAPTLLVRARTFAEEATGRLSSRARVARVDRKTAALAGWTRLGPFLAQGGGQSPEIRALVVGEGAPAPWFAAVRGAGLWRSVDLGGSWQQCPGLPAQVHAVRPVPGRPGAVYAATADGCWFSADAGQTWEDRSGGLDQARHVSAVEVKPGAPDVLLAGAAPAGGRDFSLYESTNGGKAWSLVRRGNPDVLEGDTITDLRHDPAAPNNVIMALASGELWITTNGGAYWTPLARQIRAARVLSAAV